MPLVSKTVSVDGSAVKPPGVVTAPLVGPGLNGFIWFFTYRFTIWPIAVVLPLFGALGVLIPVLSCRAAQRYSVVERLRQE